MAACLAAIGLLAASPVGASAQSQKSAKSRELLERHAPELRYDSRERVFAVPLEHAFGRGDARLVDPDDGRVLSDRAELDMLGRTYRFEGLPSVAARTGDFLDLPEAAPSSAGGTGPAYARAVRDGRRRLWLQYWLFYLADTHDRRVLSIGRHEGDWELVQVRLDRRGRPVEVATTQHNGGEHCSWDRVERTRAGAAPVIYVANGSHAGFFSAGTRRRTLLEPRDQADGRGTRGTPPLQLISEGSPRWVGWPGRWGASRGGFVPGTEESPRGPAFQDLAKWTDPGEFSELHTRGCGECALATCGRLGAAPFLLWPGAPLLGLVALLVVVVVGVRRVRRRSASSRG